MSSKVKRYMDNPRLFLSSILIHYGHWLPDRIYLKWLFYLQLGYKLNLKNPQTYNEKLQWLKLYAHRPEYTMMVDKVAVKEYVSQRIGSKYVIPTIGVWDKVEDISWESLPEQFVVKSANDSGGVVVCREKNLLDKESAILKLKKLGGRDYTKWSKEYPYKNVPHRFLAEEYLDDGYGLIDYKIFCFNGEPKFLFIATGRQQGDVRFDFYDTEFNHLPVLNGHPNAETWPSRPINFEEMLKVASELSKDIPHVRVDLYNVNGRIYFGELTFFHWSGLVPFEPREWDYEFGKYLILPNKDKCIR